MNLIFTKPVNLLSLEQFYHKPMEVHSGGLLKDAPNDISMICLFPHPVGL